MKKLWILVISVITISATAKAEIKPKLGETEEKSIVHVYRPSRLVGFGWNFNLKTNGEKSASVKNGKHLTMHITPGMKVFSVKGSEVAIDLQPGEHYYLRASLTRNMLLGKPEMIEVSEQQAQSELAEL